MIVIPDFTEIDLLRIKDDKLRNHLRGLESTMIGDATGHDLACHKSGFRSGWNALWETLERLRSDQDEPVAASEE